MKDRRVLRERARIMARRKGDGGKERQSGAGGVRKRVVRGWDKRGKGEGDTFGEESNRGSVGRKATENWIPPDYNAAASRGVLCLENRPPCYAVMRNLPLYPVFWFQHVYALKAPRLWIKFNWSRWKIDWIDTPYNFWSNFHEIKNLFSTIFIFILIHHYQEQWKNLQFESYLWLNLN